MRAMAIDHRSTEDVHVLACVECPRISGTMARGWKAYRIDASAEDDSAALAFYCPECTRREFRNS